MAQGGARSRTSDWERRLAAEKREAERQAREAARLAKEQEKARQAKHIADQQRATQAKTDAVTRQVADLEMILPNALSRRPLSFDDLKASAPHPAFNPGQLGIASQPPSWENYVPPVPSGLARIFGGASRYQQQLAQAKTRFDADVASHQRSEEQRTQALAAAKAAHARSVAEAEKRAAAHAADIEARRAGFQAGDPAMVEWFIGKVLDSSPYPKSFPSRQYKVAYRPENRDVVVELELPQQQVVPAVREYRYVKTRDAIDPVARPSTEIKQRYAKLIACVALRTLHEIFVASPAEVIEAVVLNGRVSTIDRATGKQARPHLISVEAERSAFADLVLAHVDPAACLKHLNALVSPNPFDLEAVEPFIAFDLKRFRFVDDLDTIADLDSRRNLLKLTPTEFEHLVKELFVAMGAEAWRTVPSKDGGVDAVATSKNLFFGGVCLIQAKRWTGLVGLDAVHALTGVMTDHNATTGVLVTTSWFSRTSEQFAQRNRITLINGAELKHLIKEHLKIDVIPGTNPPRNLRASNNTQTGRRGPADT